MTSPFANKVISTPLGFLAIGADGRARPVDPAATAKAMALYAPELADLGGSPWAALPVAPSPWAGPAPAAASTPPHAPATPLPTPPRKPAPPPARPAARPAQQPKPPRAALPVTRAKGTTSTRKDPPPMKAITTLSVKQKRAIASTRAVAMGNGTPAQVAEARALLGAMAHEPWYREELELDRRMGIANEPTRLSPYADHLDRIMGFTSAGSGVRNEGDQLILSAVRGA